MSFAQEKTNELPSDHRASALGVVAVSAWEPQVNSEQYNRHYRELDLVFDCEPPRVHQHDMHVWAYYDDCNFEPGLDEWSENNA